jgi:hypothetical protein
MKFLIFLALMIGVSSAVKFAELAKEEWEEFKVSVKTKHFYLR